MDGAGETADPADQVPPSPTPNPPVAPAPAGLSRAGATLPSGSPYGGRWTELAGSASGRGLSGPGAALEPSVAASSAGTYVAWADARNGNFEIYVARHTAAGWQGMAGSAEGGGVSATLGSSRRPRRSSDRPVRFVASACL